MVPQVNKQCYLNKPFEGKHSPHLNISRRSNHVPGSIKRQDTRIRKNASTASQNYLCNKPIYCPYFYYCKLYLSVSFLSTSEFSLPCPYFLEAGSHAFLLNCVVPKPYIVCSPFAGYSDYIELV